MDLLVTSIKNKTYSFGSEGKTVHVGFEGQSEVECVIVFPNSEMATVAFTLETTVIAPMTLREIAEYVRNLFYVKEPTK